MDKTISVIVPVHNNEKYIYRCLVSIQQQSYSNFEAIIIDDGSTDSTAKICKKICEFDLRFKFIHQINSGVSIARNTGLKNANGRYIAFVDSDDFLHKDYLKVLINNIEDGGLSTCKWTNNENDLNYNVKDYILDKIEAEKSVLSYRGIEGYPFCKLFDKDVIDANELVFATDISLCEDLLFVMQYIFFSSGSIRCSGSCLYYYFSNPQGALNQRFSKRKLKKRDLSEIEAVERCLPYIIENKELIKTYEMRKTKAAVVTLRTMVAKKYYTDKLLWKRLMRYVRKNWIKYITCNVGARSSKLSVVLCMISPHLEYMVWKSVIKKGVIDDKRVFN